MNKTRAILIFLLTLLMVVSVAMTVVGCDKPTATEYKVTYIYGNGQEDFTTNVVSGECAVEPKAPTWEGHEFKGWYLNGELYNFATPVNSDIELTAKWEVKEDPDPDPGEKRVYVSWRKKEFCEYVFSGEKPTYVNQGSTVSFSLKLSPYYVGDPVVTAGDEVLEANSDGIYSFVALENTIVDVSGLQPDNTPIRGSGTEADPFLIESATHLKKITEWINDPSNNLYNKSYIRLEKDLSLGGLETEPIGDVLNSTHFSGVFDGNGHTISDLTIRGEGSAVGFIGYLVQGSVKNLTLSNVTVIPVYRSDINTVVGGVVGYNMGGDIFGCNVSGQIVGGLSYLGPAVYMGGICGFSQGYSTDYTGTISYCTSEINILTAGSQAEFACGGIVGGLIGTAASAPAYVMNSVFSGSINGNIMFSGGIAGYMRNYSSVANSFAGGSIAIDNRSFDTASGGLVGLAENETAITYSYTTTKLSQTGDGPELTMGELVGKIYVEGALGVDAKEILLLKTVSASEDGFYHPEEGSAVNMTEKQGVLQVLGWTDAEWGWNDQLNIPVTNPQYVDEISYQVTFDFKGETVTLEGADGNPLSQTSDTMTAEGGYPPLYWMYQSDGMNCFMSDSGKVSYGFFLDEDCTVRLPAATLLTQSITVYVGFADYSAVQGEYLAYMGEKEVRLIFEKNGKVTLISGGIVTSKMFVYDGSKIYIRDIHFADLTEGEDQGDYYAYIESYGLRITDNDIFSAEKGNEILAYYVNDAIGTWYDKDGNLIVFRADGSGTMEKNGTTQSFAYVCDGKTVEMDLGTSQMSLTISEDGKTMQTADGEIFSITRFDQFTGDWESAYSQFKTVSFDGMGSVTYDGKQYQYTIDQKGKATFDTISAYFNDDGLLVIEQNGAKTVFGREGSFIGTWHETALNYTMVLEGIGKDGYGYGYDSNGYSFTYGVESSEGTGEQQWFLSFQVGTQLYGYAQIQYTADGGSPLLAAAVYTPSSGYIVDDYNMCYYDGFYGSWNGTNGMSLKFNGLGEYDFSIPWSGGVWEAVGQVEVTIDGYTETVEYIYDRQTATATFTCNAVHYKATLTKEGFELSYGDETHNFLEPDAYAQEIFRGNGLILSFNGKSNVGFGEATLKGETETVYQYRILEDGSAELLLDGVVEYRVSKDSGEYLVLTNAKDQTTIEMGYYTPITGVEWMSPTGTVTISHDFRLDMTSEGTFNGIEVDYIYVDVNTVQVLYEGQFLYYLVYQDEYNVALFDGTLQLVNVLTIPDGFGGTYTAQDGSTLVLDGRSNASKYVYASAILTLSVEEDGVQSMQRYSYVYQIEDGAVVIYMLDRTQEEDTLVKMYTAYQTSEQGGVQYTAEDGTSLWLVKE